MSLHLVFSWLEPVLLVSGLLMVLVAYMQYVRRTRDLWAVVKFWERRLTMTGREFAWQRSGILVLLLGVLVRYLLILQVL
ncbi:hypothetical protein [Halomonas huangheensis]|uniref:Uncharacterized protein n=1 Tax=Halomonas huangheensis TaxID=1178482 RepID=W1N3I6_9GAMM|nr:hypothetical protein [Halomonas huangheensis]ALM51571.1 hypothetical protein AR456_04145 [Halomonas huangheensis]ERL50049.1 hypothetical protein BJB45_02660 [Halomonas huangheensis]